MKAILRQIRISPKKANLVAGMVRGKKAVEALETLRLMPKKGASILYKVLHSAVHNAKNNFKQSENELFVTKILVGKGPTYKRSQPISRGRAHPIGKRTSHITVEVGLLDESVPKVTKKADRPSKAKKEEGSAKEASNQSDKKVEKKESKKEAK